MHICLICVEAFSWGKYGGFGRATRIIGRELVKQGIEVSLITPRRNGQKPVEYLDGIRILGFDIKDIRGMESVYKGCNADIFHSEEPSFGTYLAQEYHPDKKHIVTFRDTRLFSDWFTEFLLPSKNSLQVVFNWVYEDNILVHQAVRKADRHFAASKLLITRAKKHYGLAGDPIFLPTPVYLPSGVKKDSTPTVCFNSRWDRRKRPELLLDLARSFPNVRFIIAGRGRDEKYDAKLRAQFSQFSNIELPGFINQFESDRLSEILSRSWVLINTSIREGLPNSFLEICAYQGAILSQVDPDGFAQNFGYHVADKDFTKGLAWLLENDHWKEQGVRGYEFVRNNFRVEKSIQSHIDIYRSLLPGMTYNSE